MKANLLTSSKISKRLAVVAHFPMILPSPCGCVPKIAPCGCAPDACFCELELLFCDHAGEWPIEYVEKLGIFLATVDPLNYAEPITPLTPIITLAHKARLAAYEMRFGSGYSLWHENDCRPEARKNGERTASNRNGRGLQRLGAGQAPDTTCRSRWRGTRTVAHS